MRRKTLLVPLYKFVLNPNSLQVDTESLTENSSNERIFVSYRSCDYWTDQQMTWSVFCLQLVLLCLLYKQLELDSGG